MARINRLASVILACLVSLPGECGRAIESEITLMIDKINSFSNIFSGEILRYA